MKFFKKYAALTLIVCISFFNLYCSSGIFKETSSGGLRDENTLYVRAKGGLRLRKAPNLTSEITTLIPNESKVTLIQSVGENMMIDGLPGKWAKINYQNSIGWVWGGYLSNYKYRVYPIKYDSVGYFANGFASFRIGKAVGFIDSEGIEILNPKYDGGISIFFEKLARFRSKGKYGFIDTQGDEIYKPTLSDANHFSGNRAPIKIRKKWGYIDVE